MIGRARQAIHEFVVGREAARRLRRVEAKLDHVMKRLEEVAAYVAIRSHPLQWNQPVYLGDHTALAVLHGRHPVFVDTRGVDIAPHLLFSGAWEPQYVGLFQRLVKAGDTVLDIGANHGMYAVLAGAAGATVHAIEPNPRLADLLRRTVAVNGLGAAVTVHEVAAGDAEGTVRLAWDDAWSGGGHLAPSDFGAGGTERRMARVDDLLPGAVADVIKMDVEGAEGRALLGMRALLERSPDVRLIMEFAPAMLESQGVGPAPVIAFLEELGFRFWDINAEGGLTPLEPVGLAAARDDGVRNILVARREPS